MTVIRKVSLREIVAKPAEALDVDFLPNKRLKGILIRDIENIPENLRKITRAIIEEAGNLIIMRPSSPSARIVDLLYYVECPEDTEEAIASRIRELNIAEEVLIFDTPDERLALNAFFPTLVLGRRAIILREPVYSGLFNGLREIVTEGGAKTFLYMIGLRTGEEVAHSLMPIVKSKTILESLETLGLIGKALGYGDLEKIQAVKDTIIYSIQDNWEAAVLRRRYQTPQCYWTKGLLEGFLGELTGYKWKAEEEECVAMGNKRCRFTLRKESE